MNQWATAPALGLLTASLGTSLLAGAPPRPKPAAPPARTPPHATPEPTEAQLPPVDPGWRQNGWRAVVPHGYVLRRVAPARNRPEPNAPAAFWLKGGTRVPILEQRSRWWRVGWTHGRTGWMPAADLQPHAAFILIDVRTGRVLRRLAAKGELGPVASGRFLWSLSDTGITRTSLDAPPAFWSNPVRPDREGSLPEESVWTPDRSAFYLRATSEDTGPLFEVAAHTGGVRRASDPGGKLRLISAVEGGRVLLLSEGHSSSITSRRESPVPPSSPVRVPLPGSPMIHRYDARRSREIRRAPGRMVAMTRAGTVYAEVENVGGRRELVRYSPSLRPLARIKLAGTWTSACLSADERVLALSTDDERGIELRRADTLTPVVALHPGHQDGSYPHAVASSPGGWWVIAGGEPDADASVTHYTRPGQPVRTWDADGRTTIMSADGRAIFIARDSELLVIDIARGTVRRVPYRWRRPLPARYLPPPSEPDVPTHLDISRLTLSPEGRTLILTEWLNGDPAG